MAVGQPSSCTASDEGSSAGRAKYQDASTSSMDAGAKAFSAMDQADTPGTRASVDMCEVKQGREAALDSDSFRPP
jgi:hypothetical protein